MNYEVDESQNEYIPDAIGCAVRNTIAKELDRKRKLGLPTVFGKDRKVSVMIGGKIIKERKYEERTSKRENKY